jgi:hypothetical protein
MLQASKHMLLLNAMCLPSTECLLPLLTTVKHCKGMLGHNRLTFKLHDAKPVLRHVQRQHQARRTAYSNMQEKDKFEVVGRFKSYIRTRSHYRRTHICSSIYSDTMPLSSRAWPLSRPTRLHSNYARGLEFKDGRLNLQAFNHSATSGHCLREVTWLHP